MTTHKQIVKALEDLGAKEWTLSGDDIADIVWLTNDVKTEAEITAAIANPLPDKTEIAKAAAEAKLAALGLTTDDLKALGLGSN
jgi:hypothetical protein